MYVYFIWVFKNLPKLSARAERIVSFISTCKRYIIYYVFIYYIFIYFIFVYDIFICYKFIYFIFLYYVVIYNVIISTCERKFILVFNSVTKTLMPWSSYIMIITIIVKDTISLIITTILPWSSSWSSPFLDDFRKTDLVLRGASLLSRVVLVVLKQDVREGIKKNRLFLGKSPKLWVGGGQES